MSKVKVKEYYDTKVMDLDVAGDTISIYHPNDDPRYFKAKVSMNYISPTFTSSAEALAAAINEEDNQL